MTKKLFIITGSMFFVLLLNLVSCDSRKSVDVSDISTDSAAIASGQNIFLQNCSACHNFREDGIGPQLGGITAEVPAVWIKNFIKDPKKMIDSGDERARQLFEKHKTVMPSFAHYTDEQVNAVIAFLHTQKKPERIEVADTTSLKNPIPEKITSSGMVVGLELITQFPFSSEEMPRTRITKLDHQPNTDKLFVLDLRGKLYHLKKNKYEVYMDMSKEKSQFINKPGLATGFGSFAFHPDFAKNGLFYTTHSEPPGTAKADFSFGDSIKSTLQWVLSEWKTEKPDAIPFSGKSRELMRVDMVTGIHGVQEIIFNPLPKPGDDDYGMLYIGVGDGGCVENGYTFLAHSTEKIWGTVLRIDPSGRNSANGKYGIPKQNPFVKNVQSKSLGEIYAYGFRNPHRITWSRSGQMLVCNIGQFHIESLNMIFPGNDYGWPVREGTFVLNPLVSMTKIYPLPPDDKIYNITYPVAQYDHDEGKAINGGYEYWGNAIPQFTDKYLFGDIPSGRLFYVEMADLKLGAQAQIKEWFVSVDGVRKTLTELCGAGRVDVHFGRDHQGELYIMTKPDGKLYKLVSAGLKTTASK